MSFFSGDKEDDLLLYQSLDTKRNSLGHDVVIEIYCVCGQKYIISIQFNG